MKKKIINELFPRHGEGYKTIEVKVKDVTGQCKQCGRCCTSITLSCHKNVLRKWVEDNRIKDKSFTNGSLRYRKECLFIVNNFVRVSKKECRKRKLPLNIPIYWCKQLERNGNNFKCKAHTNGKPKLCKGYPKYGRRTIGEVNLHIGCGYLDDS